MYSGATDDRKNHLRLIEAFSILPEKIKKEFQLVIVGGMPIDHKVKFIKYTEDCKLNNNEVIFTDKVTDEEMNFLYNLCTAFIFPSWHEGFGLPALEAMQCGKAVIASNTSSLPEVIGREDALFDPFNVKDISSKINLVLSNIKYRKSLEEHSLIQVKKFSWDITAKKAIEAIEKHALSNTVNKDIKNNSNIDKLITNIAEIKLEFNENQLESISKSIYQNNRKKHIFVDISELVRCDHATGIQRVTKNILYQLLKNPPREYIIVPVYATEESDYFYAYEYIQHLFQLSLHYDFMKDEVINTQKDDIFLCLDMSPPINIAHESFYSQLLNQNIKVYFIVHDILPLLHPEWWVDGVSDNFEKWLKIVFTSNGAICVSNQTANDLKYWIRNNKLNLLKSFKISVSCNGIDFNKENFTKGLPETSNKLIYNVRQTISFIMVGTLEPRKGHKQTLLAFESLWENGENINLVIIGKQGWMMEDFITKLTNHPELNKRLFWLEGISDEYLEKVYEASTCLIAASEGEGFGLPLIEAVQHKKPIIARDIPVFREVAGEFAYYFENSNEPNVLAYAIKEWLDLYKNDKYPKSDDMPWLTWEESAKFLLKAIIEEG